MKIQMEVELLQPWSTFVMKTKLPADILEKMIKITDDILEDKANKGDSGAFTVGDTGRFYIENEILEQEHLMEFFLGVCKNYVIQAFCQSSPFNKENILEQEWLSKITFMWINSQKDKEYLPFHHHPNCDISSAMYLKIPEYLPSRNTYRDEDGRIAFINPTGKDRNWGESCFTIQPEVGDFFIFSSSLAHLVYPFRTAEGKGERRSVSFNAIFSNKTEQDRYEKQQRIQ